MTLSEEIARFQERMAGQIPAGISTIMKSSTTTLAKSGILDKAKSVGDKAPAFSLPNSRREIISSESLLKKGPLVISFYRGSWCPYCNLEMKALQTALASIEKLGATLVAISPSLPEKSTGLGEKHSISFEILSDIGNKVAREYNVVFVMANELRPIYSQFGFDIENDTGNNSYEIPIPATYVVDTDGTIVSAFVDVDHTKRMEPSSIIETLESIARK
ncbi:hypothetical protein MNBD_NITROSPINAE02-1921 [hydrothermal vent metagenome]|uniref:thioredoxin-dependent peroxiredoxin n=1 Tax=hydrothermal vent metagenome TaxID=652676 RepID=A0A3B1D225_9ZZZZ